MELTVISTFAGCGGSSLGYKNAGYKEILAIEWEKHAVNCFRLNFPSVPIWQKDIKQITSKEILDFCNIKQGELDIFDGSPPCQGFSITGQRKVNDIRNDLFQDYKRLINGLQPKIFVMENVSGMIKGKMKGRFLEIIKELKSLNYNVKCKIMNSKYYNVPQTRERLIFIGIRKDLNKQPVFPKPTNKIITIKEALKNCPEDKEIFYIKPKFCDYTEKILPGKNGSSVKKNYNFNLTRAHYNKTCPTVCKKISPNSIFGGILHPVENRYFTISEIKRLCSFPDDFKLIGKFKDQWARLGNAVMPKFMQAIAETLKNEILIPYYEKHARTN